MADIFKEVDEDLRRDNLEKLWKKYGLQIIGLAAAVVLGVAGVQGWQAYDLDQRSKLSDRYGAARELAQGGETTAGLDAMIDLSEASGGGYAGLAAFEEARLRVDSGDTGGAIRSTARELLALIALGEGDAAAARALYTKISDDREAPAGLRQRATQMLAALKE